MKHKTAVATHQNPRLNFFLKSNKHGKIKKIYIINKLMNSSNYGYDRLPHAVNKLSIRKCVNFDDNLQTFILDSYAYINCNLVYQRRIQDRRTNWC